MSDEDDIAVAGPGDARKSAYADLDDDRLGFPAGQPFHAWYCHGAHRPDDRRQASCPGSIGRGCASTSLIRAFVIAALAVLAGPAGAESLRIATYNANLSRQGPGLLARDLAAGRDPQILAVAQVIAKARPDVLLVTEFDWDAKGTALAAFQTLLAGVGAELPFAFAFQPNTGLATGLDLDGDGALNGARDAQGYGRFSGHRGMAILSRLPINGAEARDFSAMLWRDLPGAAFPSGDLPAAAADILRLSTTGHWDVPLTLADGRSLHLLAWSATPPAFQPLQANIARNHDEAGFWTAYLNGALPLMAPTSRFVILGDANTDVADGSGNRAAMKALLSDHRLTDPAPKSPGGAGVALPGKVGDPALDTADWAGNRSVNDNLRVDYVLPSADLTATGAGVIWPSAEDPFAAIVAAASPHRLVWVDVEIP